jgi:hypothetical protein
MMGHMRDRFIDHPSGKLSAKEIGAKFKELNDTTAPIGQFALRACELAYGVSYLEEAAALGSSGNMAAPPKDASVVYDTEFGLAIVSATDGASHLHPRRTGEHVSQSPILEGLIRRVASQALSRYLLRRKASTAKTAIPLPEFL